MYLQRKQVDDVMGGENSWKNVDSTDGMLYFAKFQLHARSVITTVRISCSCKFDRQMSPVCTSYSPPVTTFYKCTRVECGFQWREN